MNSVLLDSHYNRPIKENPFIGQSFLSYKNFELKYENGVFYVFKNTKKGGARIGIVLKEENTLYYYSSEGMAYTGPSLKELQDYLSFLDQFKDEFDVT